MPYRPFLAAALLATTALSGAVFAPVPEADAHGRVAPQTVEVVFVLDTTGSMSGLIEGAKRRIWAIASETVDNARQAEVRMGLVAYRDIGDDYVVRSWDLTTDINALYGNLLGLQANGGGDWPESVNEALSEAVTDMSWSQGPDVRRIVFLVGDAPPHMDYAQDRKYPDTLRIASRRDILVNAIQAGDSGDTQRIWREIAQRGQGAYAMIPQDGGVAQIATPWDDQILNLQHRINGTVVPYGTREMQDTVASKVTRAMEAAPSVASDMASYMAKKAGRREVITGGGDLVAEVESGTVDLDRIEADALPEPMRAMSPAERSAYVAERQAARSALQSEIDTLVQQRDAYVAKEETRRRAAGEGDGFDLEVKSMLKAQITAE